MWRGVHSEILGGGNNMCEAIEPGNNSILHAHSIPSFVLGVFHALFLIGTLFTHKVDFFIPYFIG